MADHPENHSRPISRRGLFEALMRPLTNRVKTAEAGLRHSNNSCEESSEQEPKIAIIQGRFCIAYQGGMCFTCSEQCPEQGAITLDKGIPTVHADLCTGCGICHDLCPAPRNAILMAAPPTTTGNLPGPDDKPVKFF